ncbi:DUF5686 and carboxypeptidase regulatory-like domain-containing protein [Halosquirtibacter xylanolyticus]|uniref:DUF5686 and carboxypeptidase-like regulatory domain-containing protein n=1 Tax=Halosquirtibacter xylanolyticus TaxID=3374599 RepID=UPI00374A57DF|nr:DUF5686 and carboxypeptidase regulatory-like domain-containing protein [Prolixibacteraceae bacterium]
MKLFLSIYLVMISAVTYAINIDGILKNVKGEPIPYATLYVSELTTGTTSNIEGCFTLAIPDDHSYEVLVRCVGYKSKTLHLSKDTSSPLEVVLEDINLQLPDIKVNSGKDPAYDIMRKTIGLRHQHLNEISSYIANIYLRGTIAFTKVSRLMSYQIKRREGVDIKKGDVFVDESYRQVIFAYPDQYKQKVIQHKSSMPIDLDLPIIDFLSASLYQPSIEIMISPFAPSAFRHYKFRYEGFFYDGNYSVNIIQVIPRMKSKQLYSGKIYIVDGLWCIHSVDLSFDTPVGPVKMHQNFHEVKHKVWLPVDHRYEFSGGALGVKGNVQYVANFKYINVALNPTFHPEVNTVLAENSTTSDVTINSKPKQKTQAVQKVMPAKEVVHEETKKETVTTDKTAEITEVPVEKEKNNTVKMPSIKEMQFDIASYQTVPLDSFRTVPLSHNEKSSLKNATMKNQMSQDRVGEMVSKSNNSFLKNSYNFMTGETYFNNDSTLRFTSPNFIKLNALVYNPVDGFAYGIDTKLSIYKNQKKKFEFVPMLGYSFGPDKVNWDINLWYKYSAISSIKFQSGENTQDMNRYAVDPLVNSLSSFFFGDNYKKYYRKKYYTVTHTFSKKNRWHQQLYYSHKKVYQMDNSLKENLFGNDFSDNKPTGEYITDVNLKSQNYNIVGANFGTSLFLFDNQKTSKYTNLRVYAPYVHASYDYIFSKSLGDAHRFEAGISQKIKTSPSAWVRWDVRAGKTIGDNKNLHISEFFNYRIQSIPIRISNEYFSFYNTDAYSMATNDGYLKSKVIFRSPYLLLKFLPFLSSSLSREEISCGLIYTPKAQYYEVSYAFTELLFMFDVYVSSSFNQDGFDNIGLSLVLDL